MDSSIVGAFFNSLLGSKVSTKPGAIQTPEQRKPPIAASMVNVRRWAHALFTEPTPLEAFRSLDVPVLCMVGKRSTVSAHGVARVLVNALPRAELVEFEELGHMGPVTHPKEVNRVVGEFFGASLDWRQTIHVQ